VTLPSQYIKLFKCRNGLGPALATPTLCFFVSFLFHIRVPYTPENLPSVYTVYTYAYIRYTAYTRIPYMAKLGHGPCSTSPPSSPPTSAQTPSCPSPSLHHNSSDTSGVMELLTASVAPLYVFRFVPSAVSAMDSQDLLPRGLLCVRVYTFVIKHRVTTLRLPKPSRHEVHLVHSKSLLCFCLPHGPHLPRRWSHHQLLDHIPKSLCQLCQVGLDISHLVVPFGHQPPRLAGHAVRKGHPLSAPVAYGRQSEWLVPVAAV
jgi:hypothetical protein